MLELSDKERLAILETNTDWIKGSLTRIELSDKERGRALENHLIKHSNGNGHGGVQIIIGKRALGFLAAVPVGGTAAGFLAYLRSLGLLG